MAKFCKICNKPIYGNARKYCEDCKKKEHLEQMHKHYVDNTKDWQYGGKYWEQQRINQLGTAGLGEHKLNDPKKEHDQIQKELRNLGLRQKKEFWLH